MSEDKKLDLAVKAAWLSYVAGHTQDEIARDVAQARAAGGKPAHNNGGGLATASKTIHLNSISW